MGKEMASEVNREASEEFERNQQPNGTNVKADLLSKSYGMVNSLVNFKCSHHICKYPLLEYLRLNSSFKEELCVKA